VQALVAELLTSGYELTVRGGRAHSLGQLEEELEREVAQSGASAGVLVTRTDSRGTAWLCRRVNPCERLEMEIVDGELSRSRLALAVVERLRPIDLPVTAPPQKAPPAPSQSATNPLPPAQPSLHSGPRRFRVWLGGGSVLSSGIAAPFPWLSASLGAMLSSPWGLELALAGSPLPGTTESYAGSLSLRAVQGMGFAMFEPFSRRKVGLSLGLGGGALHVQENATPAPGFDGFSRSANVAVLSARARFQYGAGPVYLGVTVDPGMLVPALKVEAGAATVSRIGRPWVTLQASLGVAL
jgi:hypothetical protein